MNSLIKRKVLEYAGDYSQLFGIKDYTLHGGKCEGMRALDVKNGTRPEFSILPSKALYISWPSYKIAYFPIFRLKRSMQGLNGIERYL